MIDLRDGLCVSLFMEHGAHAKNQGISPVGWKLAWTDSRTPPIAYLTWSVNTGETIPLRSQRKRQRQKYRKRFRHSRRKSDHRLSVLTSLGAEICGLMPNECLQA